MAPYTVTSNFQGDIVGMLDSSGRLMVKYTYDAWGKPLIIAGDLANTLGRMNPFMYRSYVYDETTNLYYLRSRYYSWKMGRFMNSDAYWGEKGVLLTHSLYSYCVNHLTVYKDSEGAQCEKCDEGVGTSYEIFVLDHNEMDVFAEWLIGKYPLEPLSNSFEQAMNNLLTRAAGEAINSAGKIIPGLALAYDIYDDVVSPFMEQEEKLGGWMKEAFGMGNYFQPSNKTEIICFFGHWGAELGLRLYDKNDGTNTLYHTRINIRTLKKLHAELSNYFESKHGHPENNITVSQLRAD